jgi:hypothetical protein
MSDKQLKLERRPVQGKRPRNFWTETLYRLDRTKLFVALTPAEDKSLRVSASLRGFSIKSTRVNGKVLVWARKRKD